MSKLVERGRNFNFADHLEQMFDWSDSLIVDVGPNADETGIEAFVAWNSEVGGAVDSFDPITRGLADQPEKPARATRRDDGTWVIGVALPAVAQKLPVFGGKAQLTIQVTDRDNP